jgi:iron complex outermembrane receptor protein
MLKCHKFPLAFTCAALLSFASHGDEETIDQIVVTASPIEKSAGEIARAITIMTQDEIDGSGASSLGALLGYEPGISQSSFAPGASRPLIRGLDNFRVRIQENGVASHDASALSEDHGVPIDPLAAQQVEVVRGPASLRYGSEAIGGVIHISNNRIPKDHGDQTFSGQTKVSYSGVDNGTQSAILLDQNAGAFAFHIDAFSRNTSDYDTPAAYGHQENTGFSAQGASIGGSFIGSQGHAGISITKFESEYGIPAAEEPLRIDMRQKRIAFSSLHRFDGILVDTWAVEAGRTNYTHDEVSKETGEIGSTFDNEEWEFRSEATHTLFGFSNGAFGLHLRGRNLVASGEGGELLAPSDKKSAAIFVFEEWEPRDNLTFEVAGRIEHIETSGIAFKPIGLEGAEYAAIRKFSPWGASLGLTYRANEETVVGLSAQWVNRAPDTLELFAKGPHESTETFELGAPDLDLETAKSVDISLKHTGPSLSAEVSVFYTKYEDFIYKAFTAVSCGDDFASCGIEDELAQIKYRQQDATFKGFEAKADWQIAHLPRGDLLLSTQFDVVRGTLDGSGNVPRLPPWRAGLGFVFETETSQLSLNYFHVARQNNLAEFETPTKSYELLQAKVDFHIPIGDNSREVFISVLADNIMDNEIRIHSSFKKDDVLMPSRSIKVMLSAPF